jgi:hypothetical protein
MYMRLPILLLLLTSVNLSAQVTITPGALFHVSGNEQVTLYNISLVNNGTIATGNSNILFSGTSNASISGSQPIQFYRLEINRQPGSSVVLQRDISVSDRIIFTQGFLNLGNSDIDLGTTAFLQNESENSRVTGNGDGRVIFTTTLNAPASANPGNLGAIISSAQDLGSVTIRRGHDVQTNAAGAGSSIRRHYDIFPSNISNLNATLRMQYFEGELNSLDENSLVFFRNDDGINWSAQGFSSRNTGANWVEKTGINTFRSWTLSAAGNALPVVLKLFNVECSGTNVLVSWTTAYEQNVQRFDIQKSMDGSQWATMSTLPPSTTSSGSNYTYTDQYAVPNNYYRIAAVDKDGKTLYTSILRSSCGSKEVFKVWPNPVQRTLFVNMVAHASTNATVRFFDVRGVLVKQQQSGIQRGNNQITIDISNLPQGMYTVQAEWNNGQAKNTTQIIKQ